MSSKNIHTVYLISGVVIILILITFVYWNKEKPAKHFDKSISLKTTNGIVKVNADTAHKKLNSLDKDLVKFQSHSIPKSFAPAIRNVIDNLRRYIEKHPEQHRNLCNLEIPNIVNQALADSISIDTHQRSLAYQTILSDDEVNHSSDAFKFKYLLNNLNIIIKLLHKDICSDGVIDVDLLETLLLKMNHELIQTGRLDATTAELSSKIDPYSVGRISTNNDTFLAIYKQNVDLKESFETPEKNRYAAIREPLASEMTQYSDRSEIFRTNIKRLGDYDPDNPLLTDEELLQHQDNSITQLSAAL